MRVPGVEAAGLPLPGRPRSRTLDPVLEKHFAAHVLYPVARTTPTSGRGPAVGSWNSLIRVLISSERLVHRAAESIALSSERFWIRCAAHSARISVHGMPHTFSVYVLKKISYSRLPKRLVTHCSRLSSRARGSRWAQRSSHHLEAGPEAQAAERVAGLQRVVEELATVMDAREPRYPMNSSPRISSHRSSTGLILVKKR